MDDQPFPEGPESSQDPAIGPQVHLSNKQAAAVAEIAATCSAVTVEDRGEAYVVITRIDVEGDFLDQRLIFPDGGHGEENL